MPVSNVKMWRWMVLWQASVFLVSGTLNIDFFSPKRQYLPSSQVSCFDYPRVSGDRFGRTISEGWRPQKINRNTLGTTTAKYTPNPLLNLNEISRRIDFLRPEGDDIVREHAKLVQDINSLRQIVFVAPFIEESKDYDDSIFQEIIETSTSTTPRPTSSKPIKAIKSGSIPVILLGGASQRQIVRSQPIKFSKPTINLVGTSVSPVKHPYPFVMQGSLSSRKPAKVCMSMPMMYTTTRRPSLLERIISSIIPR